MLFLLSSRSRATPRFHGFLPRRLKAALARRTGRSEEELCFEERRRSARVAEEENLSMEESGLVMERGNRRARKEEPKLSDVRICSGVSALVGMDDV